MKIFMVLEQQSRGSVCLFGIRNVCRERRERERCLVSDKSLFVNVEGSLCMSVFFLVSRALFLFLYSLLFSTLLSFTDAVYSYKVFKFECSCTFNNSNSSELLSV